MFSVQPLVQTKLLCSDSWGPLQSPAEVPNTGPCDPGTAPVTLKGRKLSRTNKDALIVAFMLFVRFLLEPPYVISSISGGLSAADLHLNPRSKLDQESLQALILLTKLHQQS